MRSMEEDGTEVITIPGNHDPDLAPPTRYPDIIPGKIVPADTGYTWDRGGVRHFAIHGHQGDPSVRRPDAEFWLNIYDFIQRFDRTDPKASRKIRRLITRKIWEERASAVPVYVMERAERQSMLGTLTGAIPMSAWRTFPWAMLSAMA